MSTQNPIAVGSAVIWGVDPIPVTIEATVRGTTGSPRILGQVDSVVREAYHRVLSAFRAAGVGALRGVPTINFAPAGLRKTGSGFDLPMALALAGAAGIFPASRARQLAALGELALDGNVRPARGAVAVALAAAATARTEVLAAPVDAGVAALVPGITAYATPQLGDALLWLRGERELLPAPPVACPPAAVVGDLNEIRGHETPKRALLVAAAGQHNALLVGPPGSGKTALVRRLAGLLPGMDEHEVLEVLKIHTAQATPGLIPGGRRPVRAPHHSSSHVSLLGGGPDPRPGEITLAHRGLLFLDELPEFRREALEGLRQPLEDGAITIGRALRTVTMPADFLLTAAMNPCPCGYHAHPSRPCTCTPALRRRYIGRVSGPLLDRFDLQVEVPALPPHELAGPPDPAWSTAQQLPRIAAARDRQARRNRGPHGWLPNGRLEDRGLERAVDMRPELSRVLEQVLRSNGFSGRARVRLLRIARTVADLDDRDRVTPGDLLAAARLRGLERTWAA